VVEELDGAELAVVHRDFWVGAADATWKRECSQTNNGNPLMLSKGQNLRGHKVGTIGL
jgi:hypothetical protein